ncbi:MAG: alpha/beta hydrolase [Patescibacteria group bacterium]
MDIILLHGWGRGAESFQKISELLSEKGFKAHYFDFPGFGKALPPSSAWGVDEYVEFVEQYVREKNIQKFFLLGHSFGGKVAAKLAIRSPKKIMGLVLYAAAAIKPKPKAKNLIFLAAAKAGKVIFALPGLSWAARHARRLLYRLAGSSDYHRAQGIMKEVFKKTIAEDLTPILKNISVPTLIVWGDADRTTPIDQGIVMRNAISGAEWYVAEGRGHSWHVTEPKKFAEAILPFLKRHQ